MQRTEEKVKKPDRTYCWKYSTWKQLWNQCWSNPKNKNQQLHVEISGAQTPTVYVMQAALMQESSSAMVTVMRPR
jgi:hypothetical protein